MPEETFENKHMKFTVAFPFCVHLHELPFVLKKTRQKTKQKFLIDS